MLLNCIEDTFVLSLITKGIKNSVSSSQISGTGYSTNCVDVIDRVLQDNVSTFELLGFIRSY